MAQVRSPWHALRPVFLAGAAAFTWLTFSSSPASAELLPEPTPVVNEISVDAPSTDLLAPVPDVAPGTGSSPVIDNAVNAVDQVAAPPVTGLVEATEPVIEPVLESVEPVLEPMLTPMVEPVAELVAALEPVVTLAPAAPVQAVAGIVPDVATEPSATAPAVGGTPAAGPAPARTAPQQSLDAAGPAPSVPLAVTGPAGPLWAGPSASVESAEKAPVPSSSPPAPVPAAPGSGGAASGGPSPGSAAWLSPLPLVFPFLGAASAPDFLLHAPEPVAFDPGSSPD